MLLIDVGYAFLLRSFKCTAFSGFKRPKLKELEREIWNLSHELRNSINSCRLGFNTVIELVNSFNCHFYKLYLGN